MKIERLIFRLAIASVIYFSALAAQASTLISGDDKLPSVLAKPEAGELYSSALARLHAAGWHSSNTKCSPQEKCNKLFPELQPTTNNTEQLCSTFENGYSKAKICVHSLNDDLVVESFEYER